jgi:hypothetical protein
VVGSLKVLDSKRPIREAPAAPPLPHIPRFRALALFGRRTPVCLRGRHPGVRKPAQERSFARLVPVPWRQQAIKIVCSYSFEPGQTKAFDDSLPNSSPQRCRHTLHYKVQTRRNMDLHH